MKKTIFTLAVDDYAPEITALTFPLMQRYADKIGAEFFVIRERKFPDHYPAVFEKLQIHALGRDMGNDWNIFFDADALIHPDMFDLTAHLSKDTVFHHGADPASIRFASDEYFRRDGRNISSCNWCTVASDWCLDLWRPPEEPLDDLVQNITTTAEESRRAREFGAGWRTAWLPTVKGAVANEGMGFATVELPDKTFVRLESETGTECKAVVTPSHLIDDYVLSRNIARFGLKFERMRDVLTRMKLDPRTNFFHHEFLIPREAKAWSILQVLEQWKVLDLSKPELTFTI